MRNQKLPWDKYLKYKWDNKNVLDYAIQQAKEQGRLEGLLESRLEGKLEKAKDIARNMKLEGMSLDQMIKFTKLSADEIEKL